MSFTVAELLPNGSKLSSPLPGGGGAALRGVLLPPAAGAAPVEAFGGAGRGGGGLLFLGGSAGVGLSVLNGSLAFVGNGSAEKASKLACQPPV